MPFPPPTPSGVIPPVVGDPAGRARSPYVATSLELAQILGGTQRRRAILRGFLALRGELRNVGIVTGFQWVDGSFVEDKEPNDIDVVTFTSSRPPLSPEVAQVLDLARAKAQFHCDAYYMYLAQPDPQVLVREAAYWLSLFSHQRVTSQWKGIVQLDLADAGQDAAAVALLDQMEGRP